jgi:hypothetical protein
MPGAIVPARELEVLRGEIRYENVNFNYGKGVGSPVPGSNTAPPGAPGARNDPECGGKGIPANPGITWKLRLSPACILER